MAILKSKTLIFNIMNDNTRSPEKVIISIHDFLNYDILNNIVLLNHGIIMT